MENTNLNQVSQMPNWRQFNLSQLQVTAHSIPNHLWFRLTNRRSGLKLRRESLEVGYSAIVGERLNFTVACANFGISLDSIVVRIVLLPCEPGSDERAEVSRAAALFS